MVYSKFELAMYSIKYNRCIKFEQLHTIQHLKQYFRLLQYMYKYFIKSHIQKI